LLAGEANAGTFRLLLIRPVSRQKLLFAKFMAGLIYTTLLMALMLALSLGIGAILFGTGDLIVLKNTVNIFAADDVIWRFIGAYAYGLLAMITVAALSFMLSAFSDNSIGPIIGTVAIIIGLTIISTVGFSLMKPVNPYLFTYHLPSWQLFFDFEINIPKLINAILVQVVSIFLFLGITFRYFKRKDILS
jgi:ABC-2 type transport system permease protein